MRSRLHPGLLRRLALPSLWALALACGGAETTPASEIAPADAQAEGPDDLAGLDLPPPAEEPPEGDGPKGDTGYSFSGLRAWYLVGNAITPGHATLTVTVKAPASATYLDAWIDARAGVRLRKRGATHTLTASLSTLAPGPHKLRFAANGSRTTIASFTFQRSHPLYVFVSNDWDDADNPDATLRRQETLRQRHPELKLTHFVGPYTFTEGTITASRRAQLVAWVKRQRDAHGDEIGLHIHPYCSFVAAAGVTCRTSPSFASARDATGYTVILASYTEAETSKLLQKADALFRANGLGKPTSFRAGGWTAVAHTLKALSDNGYVADASGANWARLEEWRGHPGASIYEWNAEHWSDVGDTSQPYRPNTSDANSRATPRLPILELPDNGALVDYVSSAEMIAIFKANFPNGAPLARPTVVSLGYHPPNFSDAFLARMDGALAHVDGALASADKGPVVYARASELARLSW
jgi:hypothetical protein